MFPTVLQHSCGQVPLSSLPDVLEAWLLRQDPQAGELRVAFRPLTLGGVSATVIILLFVSCLPELVGEGNGTPLQSSCLENPMDGGAW